MSVVSLEFILSLFVAAAIFSHPHESRQADFPGGLQRSLSLFYAEYAVSVGDSGDVHRLGISGRESS